MRRSGQIFQPDEMEILPGFERIAAGGTYSTLGRGKETGLIDGQLTLPTCPIKFSARYPGRADHFDHCRPGLLTSRGQRIPRNSVDPCGGRAGAAPNLGGRPAMERVSVCVEHLPQNWPQITCRHLTEFGTWIGSHRRSPNGKSVRQCELTDRFHKRFGCREFKMEFCKPNSRPARTQAIFPQKFHKLLSACP
jgi:hypothetical protein